MSHRPIIDAGPSLNFFSINKERLLIGVLGPLSTQETVQSEVLRKSRDDERFRTAATVWRKLARAGFESSPTTRHPNSQPSSTGSPDSPWKHGWRTRKILARSW